MRQVKFRAWDRERNSMVKVYGIRFHANEACIEKVHIDSDMGGKHRFVDLSKINLLEYTGLKDKNEQEIYEGDIIGVTHYFIDEGGEWEWESKHEVVWGGEDYPAFELKPSLECECNGLSYLKCNSEVEMYAVIGNIHQNEDLL